MPTWKNVLKMRGNANAKVKELLANYKKRTRNPQKIRAFHEKLKARKARFLKKYRLPVFEISKKQYSRFKKVQALYGRFH